MNEEEFSELMSDSLDFAEAMEKYMTKWGHVLDEDPEEVLTKEQIARMEVVVQKLERL
jgi:hypothetical protein